VWRQVAETVIEARLFQHHFQVKQATFLGV